LCVFFALSVMENDPIIGGWKAIVIILASLSALLLTAKVAINRRANSGGNHGTGAKLPTPPPAGYEPGLATQKVV